MIEAYGLTRRFGTFTAVTDLSLQVPNGSILALLGPNGAGKTTTVRMLAGLLAPTEGEARVAGYDIRRDPDAVRARVGLVTDAPGLFEQMKVPAYLDFFASIYGIPGDERKKRVQELLSFFELTDHCDEKMVGFSKGMKQKVALARALIHQPAVLFLDEPTSGLDPLIARNVRELIVNLKHSSRSIILCTHDLDEAERLADEVAILRQGHLVASDTPARLRERSTGGITVRIEFAQPCPVPLATVQAVPGVTAAHFVDKRGAQANDGAQALEYIALRPDVVNPQLLSQLILDGAQIVSVRNEHSTLEDIYTNLMENKETQDTAQTPLLSEKTR